MYIAHCLPSLTASPHLHQNFPDFAVSPYILLPDSFGDIYLGETFSAYVAIVTGIVDIPLYNVILTVRLQTSTTTFDLSDIRPTVGQESGVMRILPQNESIDMIISHKLNELGSHTLRATVQFMVSKTSEIVSVRKFYRFNVLQPLNIVCSCFEIEDQIMIQCQITNIAKASLFLDQVLKFSFVR